MKRFLCFFLGHKWSDIKYVHRDYADLEHVKYETFWVYKCDRCKKRKLKFRGYE